MKDKKWDKKIHKLRDAYPEIKGINWSKILGTEPEVFRSIVGGVGKNGSNKTGTHSESNQKFAQIFNDDYSELPFIEALNVLWADRSLSDMVVKTGVSRQIIYDMKRGKRHPSFEEMAQIAEAFDRDPSFFLEYRIGKVLAAIDTFLVRSPETASSWYKIVTKNEGLKV
jgi:DNA-binding phage protein